MESGKKPIKVIYANNLVPAFRQKCDKPASKCPLVNMKLDDVRNEMCANVESLKTTVDGTTAKLSLVGSVITVGDIADIAKYARKVCDKCRGYMVIHSKINRR